ncbi:MAG: hypothetical protein U0575_08810 [Phycisphaerales bacterium]
MRSLTSEFLVTVAFAIVCLVAVATPAGRSAFWSMYTRMRGRATAPERLAGFDAGVRDDVRRWCGDANVTYPPAELALVAFKQERVMHLCGRDSGAWHRLASLPILAASGSPGPKLVAGDGQVPEGIYAVESLNPNSRFHLALRVNYPNALDRERARADGRMDLGGDIMIHGGSASIGCLALGDDAIERVFLIAAERGVGGIRVIIAPCDLRRGEPTLVSRAPPWVGELYAELRAALEPFPSFEERGATAIGRSDGR